jgi:hypothetical protein
MLGQRGIFQAHQGTHGAKGMTNLSTIQLKKTTLEKFNRKKLEHEARIGKRITADEFVLVLIS